MYSSNQRQIGLKISSLLGCPQKRPVVWFADAEGLCPFALQTLTEGCSPQVCQKGPKPSECHNSQEGPALERNHKSYLVVWASTFPILARSTDFGSKVSRSWRVPVSGHPSSTRGLARSLAVTEPYCSHSY